MSNDTTPLDTKILKRMALTEKTKAVIPLGVVIAASFTFAMWINGRVSTLEIGAAGADVGTKVWRENMDKRLDELRIDIGIIRERLK